MSDLGVTMVRCSTLILEWEGTRILTDPWFAMHLRGLPCFRRPGCRPEDVPPLEVVLVSHLHPDHFDRAAMARLDPPPVRVIMPEGALESLGGSARPGWEELGMWESTRAARIEIHAVPGPHTFPGPEEANYVIDLPGWGRVYFGGDARLDHGVLGRIADRFGPFGLALLPVGGTRIFGRRTVMSPADAVEAADILGARTVIPIHEGGIWMSVPPLSLHPGRASHLEKAFNDRGEGGRVLVLSEGSSFAIPARQQQ